MNWICTARRGFEAFQPWLAPWDDEAALRAASDGILKYAQSRQVVFFRPGQYGAPIPVVVKRYAGTRGLSGWLRRYTVSRAREEYELGLRALAQGLRVPAPLLCAEDPVSRASLLAFPQMPYTHNLVSWWRRRSCPDFRTKLLDEAGRFLRHIHESCRFAHDDGKASHFFLSECTPVRADEFYVLDLLGGRFYARVPEAARALNLYQFLRSFTPRDLDLGFGEADRDRVLTAYAPADAAYWRGWVERIGRGRGRLLVFSSGSNGQEPV
jgi:hypothetical protein